MRQIKVTRVVKEYEYTVIVLNENNEAKEKKVKMYHNLNLNSSAAITQIQKEEPDAVKVIAVTDRTIKCSMPLEKYVLHSDVTAL